jgi:hypothetical protein
MRRPLLRLACSLAALATLALGACGPSASGTGDDGGVTPHDAPPTQIDATPVDAVTAYPDAEPFADGGACDDWQCENPLPTNCDIGGEDICGNGADDDCDGDVDEGCGCQAGAVQSCFRGPPGSRGVGACQNGQQTCQGSGEFTFWGPCTGGIAPNEESCDTLDNDCDGCVDDNPECCVVELACPSSMPDGQPFQPYVIDGTQFYSGATTSWSWTVVGGPCDVLLAPNTSYELDGVDTSQLTFTPTLSGDYTITVTIVTSDGQTLTCTFIVHIGGPGLRVELCWDTTGPSGADIDLHIHRPGTTTPWFTTNPLGNNNATNINGDDCYYMNCKAQPWVAGTPAPNWGYANSPLAQCSGGPEGASWTAVGHCRNPRLDIDNIDAVGTPENVNIDVPQNGGAYRVMVHYFDYNSLFPPAPVTHPLVNVYCGGRLRGTYGQAPDQVPGFDTHGYFAQGDMWRVVDVTPAVAATDMDGDGFADTTDCTLAPLHPPGMTSGYWVTTNDRSY